MPEISVLPMPAYLDGICLTCSFQDGSFPILIHLHHPPDLRNHCYFLPIIPSPETFYRKFLSRQSPLPISLSSRKSKQALSQRTSHQRATTSHGLVRAYVVDSRLQSWVDLDQIHGHEAASFVDALGNVVTFAKCETASNGRASAGCPHGIQSVDIEGKVDRRIVSDVTESHFHDFANTVTIQSAPLSTAEQ